MEYKLTFEKYREELLKGRFVGLRCKDCNEVIAPPKMICMNCQSSKLEVEELSGFGEILTFTVVRVAAEGFDPPFIVALAKLQEGPIVMGNVKGTDPDAAAMDKLMGAKVTIGHKAVEADKYSAGDRIILTFELSNN